MGALDRFADRLADLEEQAASRTPQAAHYSIVDGAIEQLETYDTGLVDEMGAPLYGQRPVARFGRQPDGGNTAVSLEGPVPPAPSGYTVTPGPGTLTVRWDGSFEGGVARPTDFYAAVVHLFPLALPGEDFPGPQSVAGSVVARGGDGVTVGGLNDEPYRVVLVTATQAGKTSAPGGLLVATPGDGSSLGAIGDAVGDAAAALTYAEGAYLLAAGRNKVYRQPVEPSPGPFVEQDLWIDTHLNTAGLPVNVLHSWDGSVWQPMPMDASVTLQAGTVQATLLAAQIVLATTLVGGDLDGGHAELSGLGLRFFRPSKDEVGSVLAGALGAPGGDDFIQVYSSTDGLVVASIDTDGGLSAATAALGSTEGDVSINGRPFEEHFAPFPLGVVAWGSRKTNGAAVNGSASIAKWLEVQTVLIPDRLYRVSLTPTYTASAVANARCVFALFYSSGGTPAVTTAGQLNSARHSMPLAGEAFTSASLSYVFDTTPLVGRTEYRFLTAYYGEGGAAYPIANALLRSILTVEDMGPAQPDLGIDHGVAPPPSGTKQTYTTYWRASDSAAYRGSGSQRSMYDTDNDLVHGLDPSGFNGNGSAVAVFNAGAYYSTSPGEVGKSITAALTGADIIYAGVALKCTHAYYPGGLTVYFNTESRGSLPATFVSPTYYGSAAFAIGQTKYVETIKLLRTSLALGAPAANSFDCYGRLNSHLQGGAPVFKYTYTR